MDSFDREQYLKQLRMYYSGNRDDIEHFLEDMRESLDSYLEANPSATTAEIFEHFGHPRELQDQYKQTMWEQKQSRKRIAWKLVIAAICFASFLALGMFILHGTKQLKEVNGHSEVILEEYSVDPTRPPQLSPPPKPYYYFSQ